MESLSTIIVEPDERPRASVILMHGLGADGHDFEPLVPELDLGPLAVRWVFPHAPVRPVTLNDGFPTRAWYDLVAIDPGAKEDAEGIRASAVSIGELIQAERTRGIPAERILVAGFSQGGAMALHVGLRWTERLAGIIALSCYLPLPTTLGTEGTTANARIPVYMAHGTHDLVVPMGMAETSREALRAHGCDVSWHTYPMQHGVCAEEISDLRAWMLGVLGSRE